MVTLRKNTVQNQITNIANKVSEDLYLQVNASAASGIRPFREFDDFNIGPRKNNLVSQRFTTKEVYEKIAQEFIAQNLEEIPFEFGIVSFKGAGLWQIERQSGQFKEWYEDTVNYKTNTVPIVPPKASPSEMYSEEWLFITVPDVTRIVYKSLSLPIIIAILFTIVICAAFYLTIHTMLRQKKLSEIKNDFINNMTHEFKTPIATISLAVDAIRNEKVQGDKEKLKYFGDIIKEENQRMNRQVETILKSALMDRQEVQLNLKPLHVHTIINDVADNFILRLQEKDGTLETDLKATTDLIEGDEVHISNLVNNLMDNAVKYSKENVPPKICLTTSSTVKHFILRIEDNGIGMTRETVKRIFEKFYRAHTGNIHNVKGFGLGLSYVKTVVEAHEGTIKAESTLGKGSCFTIEFPLKQEQG
jgi:two-component system, OmpR family, phosphate regulon sensor histidine kinase PhoR